MVRAFAFVCGLVLGAWAAVAWADTGAQVITRDSAIGLSKARVMYAVRPTGVTMYRLDEHGTWNSELIRRQLMMAPAAVIGRELSEQPVYTHLAEVKVNTTSILLDPDQNLDRRLVGGMDQDNSLVQAQRRFKELEARDMGVQIIRGSGVEEEQAGLPTPRFLIIRPDQLPKPLDTPDQEKPDKLKKLVKADH